MRVEAGQRTEIMEFDFGVNQGFVEEQYLRYQGNPASVDPAWRTFFEAAARQGHSFGAEAAVAKAGNGTAGACRSTHLGRLQST